MSKLNVEFFHDVICSFCYPMSFRMRELNNIIPELNVIHRSFALAPKENSLVEMFGNMADAKNEIMKHWKIANLNDPLKRFNIEGMQEKKFLFPTSINALLASKAAGLIGGNSLYWDVFDALQKGLFTDNLDISNQEVIESLVRGVDLDFEVWKSLYLSSNTLKLVTSDFELASNYGINSIPTLVVEGKYLINGAQSIEKIERILRKHLEEKEASVNEKNKLIDITDEETHSCTLVDGKWNCE